MTASKLVLNASSGVGGAGLDVNEVFNTYLYTGYGTSETSVVDSGIALGNLNDGGSVYFPPSSGDSIDVTASGDFLFDGDFTIEFFYHANLNATWNDVFGFGASTSYYLEVGSNGNISTGDFGSSLATGNGVVDNNSWNHIAIVRSGSDTHIYCNGNKEDSSTQSGNIGSDSNYIRIGNSGENFTGYLSNFRIVKGTAVYSGSTYTVPTSQLTAITNTKLLLFQGDTPFVDNSGTNKTITINGTVDVPNASGFGPFTSSESGEGGLVWIKPRSSGGHFLVDSIQGGLHILQSHTQGGVANYLGNAKFNSKGFSATTNINDAKDYCVWTFRQAPKFFDIVTYTGNGATRTINHDLGSDVGMLMVKRTDANAPWAIWHRQLNGGTNSGQYYLQLNSSNAEASSSPYWNNTAPTSTGFTVSSDGHVNGDGQSYVAYLFAHNNSDGNFGPNGNEDIIKCGGFTTDSNGNATVNLGFEPQFLIEKQYSGTRDWRMYDIMRGWTAQLGTDTNPTNKGYWLEPNTTDAGLNWTGSSQLLSNGFKISGQTANADYIYMAIRRGSLSEPTSATDVFDLTLGLNSSNNTKTFNSSFPVDMHIYNSRGGSHSYVFDRVRGNSRMIKTDATTGETEQLYNDQLDHMDGMYTTTGYDYRTWMGWHWKRARGYFDIVGYEGTGSARTQTHNLNAIPEMMWVKGRSNSDNWSVYHKDLSAGKHLQLNDAAGAGTNSNMFTTTAPTSSVFSIGSDGAVNGSGHHYVAYLFATLAGVSKVGSYTGNGSSQNIECGFSSGARFILIKRYDSADDFYVFDSVRGIVAGDDARISFNVAQTEGSADRVDPYSGGFAVTSSNGQTNASGGTYIFYAIA